MRLMDASLFHLFHPTEIHTHTTKQTMEENKGSTLPLWSLSLISKNKAESNIHYTN